MRSKFVVPALVVACALGTTDIAFAQANTAAQPAVDRPPQPGWRLITGKRQSCGRVPPPAWAGVPRAHVTISTRSPVT